jgi:hypothetical protein
MPAKKTEVKQRRAGKQLQIQTAVNVKETSLRGAEASRSCDDLEAF